MINDVTARAVKPQHTKTNAYFRLILWPSA
jgi:hypothetical protein